MRAEGARTGHCGPTRSASSSNAGVADGRLAWRNWIISKWQVGRSVFHETLVHPARCPLAAQPGSDVGLCSYVPGSPTKTVTEAISFFHEAHRLVEHEEGS